MPQRRRLQNRIAQRTYRKRNKRRLAELEHRATSSEDAESDGLPQLTFLGASQDQFSIPRDSAGKCPEACNITDQGHSDIATHPIYSVQHGVEEVTVASCTSGQFGLQTTNAETCIGHKKPATVPSPLYSVAHEYSHDAGTHWAYSSNDEHFPYVHYNDMHPMNESSYSVFEHLEPQPNNCCQVSDEFSCVFGCYSGSQNLPLPQYFDHSANYSDTETNLLTPPRSITSSTDGFQSSDGNMQG
ncbi:hypothetical protein ACHAO7_010073 [Fusarium culmorum]